MHVIRRTKAEAPKPLVPIVSHYAIPGHRKTRNKRYNAKGEFIGYTKPGPVIDPREVARVKQAQAEAAKLPVPADTDGFDLSRYTPLRGRVLVKRPAQITEERGVTLPQKHWKNESFFIVVAVGADVTVCQPGDRVVFDKRGTPREVTLGSGRFHLGRAKKIISLIEP